MNTGADGQARVGQVEDRERLAPRSEHRDEVDNVATQRGRAREDPVDQVAQRAGEHQPIAIDQPTTAAAARSR